MSIRFMNAAEQEQIRQKQAQNPNGGMFNPTDNIVCITKSGEVAIYTKGGVPRAMDMNVCRAILAELDRKSKKWNGVVSVAIVAGSQRTAKRVREAVAICGKIADGSVSDSDTESWCNPESLGIPPEVNAIWAKRS